MASRKRKDRRMRWTKYNMILLVLAVVLILFAIWGPEAVTQYGDRSVLNQIHVQVVEKAGEGYRYTLGSAERLYILSSCLNSQTLAESAQSAWTREEETETEYDTLEGNFAFIVNRQGPSENQITEERLYAFCDQELQSLKDRGIIPQDTREIDAEGYDAELYSAIDVLEPRNNVSVWKLDLAGGQKNADKSNRLMDAYIDADTGKIYEFYVRTSLKWEDIDTDAIVREWSSYMGLEVPQQYESDNPLLETTPYYQKYTFTGQNEERIIVTVGFYEGINELFLKISK